MSEMIDIRGWAKGTQEDDRWAHLKGGSHDFTVGIDHVEGARVVMDRTDWPGGGYHMDWRSGAWRGANDEVYTLTLDDGTPLGIVEEA